MSRWISFIVLLGVIIVIAAFFLRVMAEFLVPLFVATLLVVIFRPVHCWFLEKTDHRPAWSALLTTFSVVLAVVLPFGIMLAMAAAEGREIIKRFDRSLILQKLDDFRSTFGLNVPHMEQLSSIETTLYGLRNSIAVEESEGGILSPKHFSIDERVELSGLLDQMLVESQRLGVEYGLDWPPEISAPAAPDEVEASATEPLTDSDNDVADVAPNDSSAPSGPSEPEPDPEEEASSQSFLQLPFTGFSSEDSTEDLRATGSTPLEQHWFNYVYTIREAKILANDPSWDAEEIANNRAIEWRLRAAVADTHSRFRNFKVHLLGGPLTAWIKELVNPQDDDVRQYSDSAVRFIGENFVAWGGTATFFLGRLLFGGIIAIVSVYFFLLDGPAMMASLMQLSPMDDRHERELIEEFERVSRAVVLATLVSAIAQGILAGFGFYFVGIQSVFLLTMLTMLLAMIPFFGAASVWVPVVVYVAFFENRPVAAFILFLYCALIVSTIDNIIKPYILHGQSNLHPLLALLSVLGGVTALGAIGIVVGPMLVAFLQTLLKILRDELGSLDDQGPADGDPVLAVESSDGSSPIPESTKAPSSPVQTPARGSSASTGKGSRKRGGKKRK